MAKFNIEIAYGPDGLEKISISDEPLNIISIQSKPIEEWFHPLEEVWLERLDYRNP